MNFQGIQSSIDKNLIFVIFHWERGLGPPVPLLDPRMCVGCGQLNSTTVLDFLHKACMTLMQHLGAGRIIFVLISITINNSISFNSFQENYYHHFVLIEICSPLSM